MGHNERPVPSWQKSSSLKKVLMSFGSGYHGEFVMVYAVVMPGVQIWQRRAVFLMGKRVEGLKWRLRGFDEEGVLVDRDL